jgi:hypothetical protein
MSHLSASKYNHHGIWSNGQIIMKLHTWSMVTKWIATESSYVFMIAGGKELALKTNKQTITI